MVKLLKENTFDNIGIKKVLVVGGISEELKELAAGCELIDFAAEMEN